MERPDLTVANFDFTFLEIVVPYFCFYSGNILLTLVKDTLSKQSGEKPQLVADYCTAMENRTFSARKNLIDKTLNGQPCSTPDNTPSMNKTTPGTWDNMRLSA